MIINKKIGSLWLHVPSDMKNGIIRNDYMITTTMGYGQELFWILLTKTSGGGHFMTYYASSKYYGHIHMHDNIVPWALRALGTKIIENISENIGWVFFKLDVEHNMSSKSGHHHLLTVSVQNPTYFVQCSKGLETRVLTWQHLSGCHFALLSDVHYWCKVIHYSRVCLWLHQFLNKSLSILEMGEDIPKQKTPFFIIF